MAELIRNSKKSTPAVLLFSANEAPKPCGCRIFGGCLVIDEIDKINEFICVNENILDYQQIFTDRRNSALKLLDVSSLNARVEPGAIIRDGALIKDNAVIMMGAVINIGAEIGRGTMVDMNAVVGAGAVVGDNSHVGAGAVIAGVIEPPCASPAVIGSNVMIGANATVLEGIVVGDNAVVAAGSVVTRNIPASAVVAGVPAQFIKWRDGKTDAKTEMVKGLREL